MSEPRLIGLIGFAGSGKDEVARLLIPLGFARVAFADKLKAVAADIGWDGQKDEAGRALLQNLGLAVREHIAEDVWVDAAMTSIQDVLSRGGGVVVTDVRFPNEIELMRAFGAVIWRVDRPGVGPVNGHVSELAWNHVIPDAVVDNGGTLDDLAGAVNAVLEAQ